MRRSEEMKEKGKRGREGEKESGRESETKDGQVQQPPKQQQNPPTERLTDQSRTLLLFSIPTKDIPSQGKI